MTIYWLTCIATIFTTDFALRVKHDKKNMKYYLLLAFFSSLPLNILCSIRYNVGKDYFEYKRYFELIASQSVSREKGSLYFKLISSRKEIGQLEYLYYKLNKLIAYLGGDYRWLFAICSTIFLVFIFLAIFHDSPFPNMSVYFLVSMSYYFIFMNGMRQMIGCAILLFSLRYVEKRKLLPFVLCVILAAGFHTTCLPFIIIYWIANFDFKPRRVAIMTIIIIICSNIFGGILTRILYLTPYVKYIGSDYDSGSQGRIILLINLLIVVLGAIFYDVDDKRYKIYFNIQIGALWVTILTGKVVLISRMRWMLGLPSIILLPLIFTKIKSRKNQQLIEAMIIGLYFVYCTYRVVVFNSNTVLPYQTIFGRS